MQFFLDDADKDESGLGVLPFAVQGRGSPFALRVATLAVLLTSVFLLYGIQALGFFLPKSKHEKLLGGMPSYANFGLAAKWWS